MQNEGVHDDRISCSHDAQSRCRGRYDTTNFVLSQNAKTVRARNDAETAPFLIRIVEVQADGDHLVQDGTWWLNVVNAVFPSPRPPSIHVESLVQRYGSILVPSHEPVPLRGFVEKERAHKPNRATQKRLGDGEHRRIGG